MRIRLSLGQWSGIEIATSSSSSSPSSSIVATAKTKHQQQLISPSWGHSDSAHEDMTGKTYNALRIYLSNKSKAKFTVVRSVSREKMRVLQVFPCLYSVLELDNSRDELMYNHRRSSGNSNNNSAKKKLTSEAIFISELLLLLLLLVNVCQCHVARRRSLKDQTTKTLQKKRTYRHTMRLLFIILSLSLHLPKILMLYGFLSFSLFFVVVVEPPPTQPFWTDYATSHAM